MDITIKAPKVGECCQLCQHVRTRKPPKTKPFKASAYTAEWRAQRAERTRATLAAERAARENNAS